LGTASGLGSAIDLARWMKMNEARINKLQKAGTEMLNLLEADGSKHNIWRKLFNKE